jgi:hypothetical protein
MNLTGRNLTQELAGADVEALQGELQELGYMIPATKTSPSSFGAGTLAAVQQLQTDNGFPANGIVDQSIAAALSEAILTDTYRVSGTALSAVSAGVGGLDVTLVDKNVGGDVTVASRRTKEFCPARARKTVNFMSSSSSLDDKPIIQCLATEGNMSPRSS